MPQKSSTSDNPKAFKHRINQTLVNKIGTAIKNIHPEFKLQSFLNSATNLDTLELKARVILIADNLNQHLDQDYKKALKILLNSLKTEKLTGFDLWPYTHFVQTYGVNHLEPSLEALYILTQKFTSEFAVRPFIVKHQERTLKKLESWTKDKNTDVRRWVSEGTRPRLPWGERLPNIIKKPELTLRLLEKLKYDPELYVRKSVANHLNDISKDHPELVVKTLAKWNQACPDQHNSKITWITKQALRSLIKLGSPGALKLLGVQEAKLSIINFKLEKEKITLGETLNFSFKIKSLSNKPQKLVVDYVIYHKKANQTFNAKVFKLKTLILPANETVKIQKKHAVKLVTVRKYYSGIQGLELQINGVKYMRQDWVLSD